MTIKPTYEELEQSIKNLKMEASALKHTEEALRRERNKAQKYLDIAGVIIVVINADKTVALINKKGCEILGFQEEDIIGRNWFENFLPERIRGQIRIEFARLLAGEIEPVEYYENPILTKDGEERMIAWHNTVMRDKENNIVSTLSSGEDITDRKQAEEALYKAHKDLSKFNKELEKTVQKRTEELMDKNKQLVEAEKLALVGKMANRVAHELRNPITVMGGFARRMHEKTSAGDPNKKYLEIVLNEVAALEKKVSEIIKIDKGEEDTYS